MDMVVRLFILSVFFQVVWKTNLILVPISIFTFVV